MKKCFASRFLTPVLSLMAGMLLSACQPEEQVMPTPAPSAHPAHAQGPALRGFIDKTGKFVIKPQFITASSFHEGLAHVVDPRGSFIDKNGNFVIKEKYYVAGDFSEGLAYVALPKPKGNWSDVNRPGDQLLYGYIDKTGKIVITPQFKTALDFSEGLAAVMPQDSKVWGFIDKQGKMVITPQFLIGMDDIERDFPAFKHGVAFVTAESGPECIDKSGKALDKQLAKKLQHLEEYDEEGLKQSSEKEREGYVDKTGKIVIAWQFDKVTPFYDGLGLVRKGKNNWGFIDRSGKFVIAPGERFEYERFSEGLCAVKDSQDPSGNYGFIDKTGKLVIPPSFPNVEFFRDGMAAVAFPASDEEIKKIKMPFEYKVQGNNLEFPMKLSDSDDEAAPSSK